MERFYNIEEYISGPTDKPIFGWCENNVPQSNYFATLRFDIIAIRSRRHLLTLDLKIIKSINELLCWYTRNGHTNIQFTEGKIIIEKKAQQVK